MQFLDLFASPLSAAVAVAALGVLFVNGWTDAPNAIASAIATNALSMRQGVLLAGVMNALGGLSALLIGQKVAQTVYFMGDLSSDKAALAAALASVILWAVAAWRFGIPTSESHGLMASILGSAVALGGAVSMVAVWRMVSGLVLSVSLGFLGGRFFGYALSKVRASKQFWQGGQVVSAGLMAFAHGLQDTPKFASVLLLCKGMQGDFELPFWLMLLCSGVISFGTLLGGGRIIRKVGGAMVQMDLQGGFAADLAGTFSLLLSTLQGLPVSTTHAKTCAMMGAAGKVDFKIAASMFVAWFLTFPACFFLSFFLTKLFTI